MNERKSDDDIAERTETEQAQRRMDELFRALIENSSDVITIIDAEGVIRYEGPSIERVLGYKPAELIGTNIVERLHPDDVSRVIESYELMKAAATPSGPPGTGHVIEARLRHKDGSWRVLEGVAKILDTPFVSGIVVNSRDITERKRAEQTLHFSQHILEIANRHTDMLALLRDFVAEFESFTGCAAVGIRILDQNGNIPYQAYRGFSQRFYESESPLSIKSDQCMCIDVIKGLADPKRSWFTEGGSFFMNGTTRFLATVSEEEKGRTRSACNQFGYESVALVPIRFGGRILGLIHVADPQENMVPLEMVEVLEGAAMQLGVAMQRVKTEESLRESEERFRRLYEQAPLGYQSLDAEGRLLDVNPAWLDLLGYSRDEVIGRWFGDFLAPQETESFRQRFPRFKAAGEVHVDLEMARRDGSPIIVHIDGRIGHDEHGQFKQTHCILTDITARKQAEARIAYQANLLAQVSDAIVASDEQYRLTAWNAAAEAMYGWKAEEVLGRYGLKITRTEWADANADEMRRKIAETGQWRDEATQQRKDGTRFPVEVSSMVLRDEKGQITGYVSVNRDITERKRAEEALRESEEKYRNLVERANDGIVIVQDRIVRYVNPRLAEMWGGTVDETIDTPFAAHVHPDELPQLVDRYERRLAGEDVSPMYETILWRKDGSKFQAEINAGVITYQGKPADLIIVRDITERKRAEEEIRTLNAELEQRVAARTAELTQREAALREANEKLKELDRMKSQFISSVSHELRTPLTNIITSIYLLDRKPEKHDYYMTTLRNESDLLRRLIEDLLQLSRLDLGKAPLVLKPVDINAQVVSLIADRTALFAERGLSLVAQTAPDLPLVQADPNVLGQVLTNLLTNAMTYTPAGGTVTVSTGVQQGSRGAGEQGSGGDTQYAPRNTWVTFSVTDTGPGITAEEQAHIFERFYRGEAARQSGASGTGLGLTICQEIIHRHGGRITVASQVGQGSTFTVWLPADGDRVTR